MSFLNSDSVNSCFLIWMPFISFLLLLLLLFFVLFYFVCFCFLGRPLQHMEVPRLGLESELQLLASATARAMPDPSQVCSLHHSSWQCWILNPLSEGRDRTRNLIVPIRIRFHCAIMGIPKVQLSFFLFFFFFLFSFLFFFFFAF